MVFWDILVYFSIGLCYFSAVAVAYGWIKHGINQRGERNEFKK